MFKRTVGVRYLNGQWEIITILTSSEAIPLKFDLDGHLIAFKGNSLSGRLLYHQIEK